jgi:S-layer protein (TIGR01567 family)
MKIINILSILMTTLMLSSVVGAVEIRGTVVIEGTATYTWSAQNFAGFYYDIDNNLSSESMTIESISGRTIPTSGLVYHTEKIPINFSYSKEYNKPVYDDVTSYSLVGWKAEKWIALNGKANKLVKILTEIKGTDKVTLTSGGTLTLGNGYVLKINSVDANAEPRQAWISIMKDGSVIDDAIMQQGKIYNLRKDVGGEKNTLVLSAYVSSIFSGGETQMIQLQHIWLIDESTFTEVLSGSKYGAFEVTEASSDKIVLRNSGTLTLSKNSVIDLMGNMKFKVADSETLRFYPKVDEKDQIVEEIKNVVQITTPTPIPTPVPTQCIPEVVEKIVEKEKIIYVNVTVTPEPTPKPTISGFESILAISGMFVAVFLVMKQRKD